MTTWFAGLIVTGELACDDCNKLMKHPDRYGYICEEGESPLHLCESCSQARGYLKWKKGRIQKLREQLDAMLY